MNVYQISAKEHQVVPRVDADEISVSETLFSKYSEYIPQILHNSKKLKQTKIVEFKYSSALSVL